MSRRQRAATSPATAAGTSKRSNAKVGSYYKARTKKWLAAAGYAVAHLEEMRQMRPPGRAPLFVKRDQLGCDLLAVNEREVLFVQVKFHGDEDRRKQIALREALALLRSFPCPPCARQVVLVWRRGDRSPQLMDARDAQV